MRSYLSLVIDYSRVDKEFRGNLVLTHSVPLFRYFEALRIEWLK